MTAAPPPVRVLVVDDADDIRELLAISLRLAGAEVVTAESGPGALAALADARFDAMVLDVQMPDYDGWDVLAAVAAAPPPRPKVIVCSVKSGDAVRQRAQFAGAAAYITKPFDVAPTVERIIAVARAG